MTDELWDSYHELAQELGWTDYGTITWEEQVWDWFTAGECHALALSIHYRTTWPMYFISDTPEEEYKDPLEPAGSGHVVVLMPNGLWLDIGGPSTLEHLRQSWSDYHYPHMFECAPHDFEGRNEPDVGVADLFAEAILAYVKVPNGQLALAI